MISVHLKVGCCPCPPPPESQVWSADYIALIQIIHCNQDMRYRSAVLIGRAQFIQTVTKPIVVHLQFVVVVNIHLNDDAVENDSDGRLINNMIRTLVLSRASPGSLPDLGPAVSGLRERGDQLTGDRDGAETQIRMINVWSDPRSASSAELPR